MKDNIEMVNKELISIIVPIYNAENYLYRCLDSIINQTYAKLQIILVDDGSTDSSGEICEQYAKNDARIEVIHTINKGVICARKTGVKAAKGKYVGFVDSDDYIDNDYYEKLYICAEKNNAEMVQTGYKEQFENVVIRNHYVKNGSILLIEKREDRIDKYLGNVESMEYDINNSLWNKLIFKDILESAIDKIPDYQSYGEDLICISLCLREINKIVFLEGTGYHYIRRTDSITSNEDMLLLKKKCELYETILKLFSTEPKSIACLKRRILHTIAEGWSEMTGVHVLRYYFNEMELIQNKKVVIYGAGAVGKDYYIQMRLNKELEVVAIVDKNFEYKNFEYSQVVGVDQLFRLKYDVIIIAVLNRTLSENIRKELISLGIDDSKIIWFMPISRY